MTKGTYKERFQGDTLMVAQRENPAFNSQGPLGGKHRTKAPLFGRTVRRSFARSPSAENDATETETGDHVTGDQSQDRAES